MKNITIICGSTSSGKSDFTFQLAKKTPPSLIISADSRQFYKGLSIVSGQDDQTKLPKETILVGQDFLYPTDSFSIRQFKNYFETQIKLFPHYNLYVVGGSGLYLKAITQNLETVSIPQNLDLRKDLNSLTLSKLQEVLKQKNLNKFNSLNNSDLNNPRRLIRAIEVATYLKENKPPQTSFLTNLEFKWIGIKANLNNLEKNIKKRVINRIENGALEEVETLLSLYSDRSLPIYTTLGVSEIIKFLDKEINIQQLISAWTTKELQYAKRQITWFNKQPNIVWYDKDI